MKTSIKVAIALIVVLLAVLVKANAQNINNGGFENWTLDSNQDSVPNGWWKMFSGTSLRTTDSYAGNYAAVVKGIPMCGIAPGIMTNGQAPFHAWDNPSFVGTPINTKFYTFSGHYKNSDICVGDSSIITVLFKKYNAILHKIDTVAYGQLVLAPVTNYTSFQVNISDVQPGIMPDSVLIRFENSKYNCFKMDSLGLVISGLYIDQLSFVREIPMTVSENETKNEVKIYPNPFSNTTVLTVSNSMDEVCVEIVDIKGEIVKTIVGNNTNRLLIDRNGLADGTYLYRLWNGNSMLQYGKLVIM